jgi:hypothetical protein
MKIIYAQDNGILAQITPTPEFLAQLEGTEEEKLIHIANKDLPTGTPYEITDEDLSDRTFRNAWEYTADASVEKTSADLSEDDLAKYNMTENL